MFEKQMRLINMTMNMIDSVIYLSQFVSISWRERAFTSLASSDFQKLAPVQAPDRCKPDMTVKAWDYLQPLLHQRESTIAS